MAPSLQALLALSACLLSRSAVAQMVGTFDNDTSFNPAAFDLVNGRIFTPGLAIIASPQPNTPMGGDFLHVALDISADGKLPFPPPKEAGNLQSFIHNITLFLTSTETGKNFTISNGTTTTPPLANILTQESGSTVKHVNFEWPDCLVGDGRDTRGTARGTYNISIHQSFRLNGSEYYTVMNLPISVTNKIDQFPGAKQLTTYPKPGPLNANGGRMQCGALENEMLSLGELEASVNNPGKRPLSDGMGVGTTFGEIGNESGDGQGVIGNSGDGQGLIGNSGNALNCGLSLLLASLMLGVLAV